MRSSLVPPAPPVRQGIRLLASAVDVPEDLDSSSLPHVTAPADSRLDPEGGIAAWLISSAPWQDDEPVGNAVCTEPSSYNAEDLRDSPLRGEISSGELAWACRVRTTAEPSNAHMAREGSACCLMDNQLLTRRMRRGWMGIWLPLLCAISPTALVVSTCQTIHLTALEHWT